MHLNFETKNHENKHKEKVGEKHPNAKKKNYRKNAQRKKIAVSPFPIEFYYNDPHSGTDEMTWKTEIFFPLANENKSKKAAYHD